MEKASLYNDKVSITFRYTDDRLEADVDAIKAEMDEYMAQMDGEGFDIFADGSTSRRKD